MTNEIHDQESDRNNRNAGPFTGGSQVLVSGGLAEGQVRRAANRALLIAASLAVVILAVLTVRGAAKETLLSVAMLLGLGFVLGPGYTATPLKFVYRGVGEWVVAFTHTTYMILCGWVIAGGPVFEATPWLISIPMFLAVFASISLASIPDQVADGMVNKRSISVMCSPRGAALTALVATIAAVCCTGLLPAMSVIAAAFFALHGILVVILIVRYLTRWGDCRRIDLLLFASLQFVLWFAIWPLLTIENA